MQVIGEGYEREIEQISYSIRFKPAIHAFMQVAFQCSSWNNFVITRMRVRFYHDVAFLLYVRDFLNSLGKRPIPAARALEVNYLILCWCVFANLPLRKK